MDFKFNKDTEDRPNQPASGDKGRQNMLLVVLLVLVAGFAYIYFFTGLIKPQEAPKPAEAPAPQVVKKALPPRAAEPAAPEAKQAPVAPVTSAAPVKPEPPKVAQAASAAAPVVKEAPKPKEEPKNQEPAKPAQKKPLPATAEKKEPKPSAAKAEVKKQAPTEKKQPAVGEKKAAPAVAVDKKVVAAKKQAVKAKKKPVTEPDAASSGHWTLVVGNYLLEDALATDLVRVRKAGLEAAVQSGARKKSNMNRLFVGAYDDRSSAKAALDKLRQYTSDAFILDHDGKHAVYAGSYLLDARAASEKERLAGAGIKIALKRVEVAIPSKVLTAGSFNDKKTAEAALKKLKGVGLKASLTHQ